MDVPPKGAVIAHHSEKWSRLKLNQKDKVKCASLFGQASLPLPL